MYSCSAFANVGNVQTLLSYKGIKLNEPCKAVFVTMKKEYSTDNIKGIYIHLQSKRRNSL